MNITEVSVRYGRTVQPRPFESERVEVGLTATVGEDQLWVSVLTDLSRMAQERVELHLQESQQQRSGQYQRRWGHPVPEDDGPPEDEEDDDADPETTRRMGDGY